MRLAAERFGAADSVDGPAPLLIAHGLFGSGRNWMTLAKRFAERRPAAVVDLRNHGVSPWVAEMDYPSMGRDLLDTAESLFQRPPLLLGHSMGGKAAMAAALTGADRIAGLIVADIAPISYAGRESGEAHAGYVAAMRAADLSRATRRTEVDPQLSSAIPSRALRAFILANLVFEAGPEGRRAQWRLNLDAIAEAMPAIVDWPEALAAERYAGPSLFLHGGASDYVDRAGRAAIDLQFPSAEIASLPGAGHWLHAEQPDAFFERVSDWLERL